MFVLILQWSSDAGYPLFQLQGSKMEGHIKHSRGILPMHLSKVHWDKHEGPSYSLIVQAKKSLPPQSQVRDPKLVKSTKWYWAPIPLRNFAIPLCTSARCQNLQTKATNICESSKTGNLYYFLVRFHNFCVTSSYPFWVGPLICFDIWYEELP